ncbi:MAG: hypothetical protein ACNA8W_15080 [Bradymonadaceae bacterium]
MEGMIRSRCWRVFAVVMVFSCAGLMACNGDNNDDDQENGALGSFDLSVSGDFSEQLSTGQTQYHLNEDEGFCALTVADERSDRIYSVQLYYVSNECPSPGVYEVLPRNEVQEGQFWGLFTVLGAEGQPVFGSTSGTVEVTARPNNRIEGEMDATFVHLIDEERTVDVSGSFEVVVLAGSGD